MDFFSPINVSSESRARAFLWLCYHYHEAPSRNPFDDDYARKHPGLVPSLESLSPEEASLENVDSPGEVAWGEKMTAQRKDFMAIKDTIGPLLGPTRDTQEPEIEPTGPSKRKTSRRSRGRGIGRVGIGQADRDASASLREISVSPGRSHRRSIQTGRSYAETSLDDFLAGEPFFYNHSHMIFTI